MNQHLRKIQCFFSFSAFLLSSLIIFNPLYSSQNPIISLCVFIITGYIILFIITTSYNKIKTFTFHRYPIIFLSFIACTLSALISLILLTGVIKETSFITNRNVSMIYYAVFTLFVLSSNLYLCSKAKIGIYRLSIVCCVFFFILLIFSLSTFFSTKGIAKIEIPHDTTKSLLQSAIQGLKAGLYISLDSVIFLFCFDEYLKNDRCEIYKKTLISSYFACCSFYTCLYAILVLTFGKTIVANLDYPQFSLLKLVYGFDGVEILSFTLIPAYMIKSSVYIYSASLSLSSALSLKKSYTNRIVFIIHCVIVGIIALSFIFSKQLGDAAFQHTIFSLNAVLCIIFIFLTLSKK